jgi:hypothetical protein
MISALIIFLYGLPLWLYLPIGCGVFFFISAGLYFWGEYFANRKNLKNSALLPEKPQLELQNDVISIKTSLQLQYTTNNAIPLALGTENIWRWYSLKQNFLSIDKKTKQQNLLLLALLFL